MDRIALLLGLFGVPILLLWLGDSLRKKTVRQRRLFWGVVIGHSAGMVVTFFVAMIPPIWWSGGGSVRIWIVHWSMLVASAAGALVALARSRDAEPGPAPRAAAPRPAAAVRDGD